MNFVQVTNKSGRVLLINVELIEYILKCSNTKYDVLYTTEHMEFDSKNAEIIFRAIGKRFE